MDLGLTGRKAIVCASSAGLGKACATSLAREGCHVFVNGRDEARLTAAAREIRDVTGAQVIAVRADIATAEGRAALLAACPAPDILVNNNAGPEPGDFVSLDRERWDAAMEANFYAPMLLMQAVLPGMRERRWGRIVNITSARVKTPTPTMALSSAPRAGVTALARALALEVAADNVTVNNLLPERFATDRQVYMADRLQAEEGLSAAEAMARFAGTIAAKRLGRPSEFGDACAFLCSEQAGYISGQNLQLDGGSYRGLL